MKQFVSLCFVVVALIFVAGCSVATPGVGQEAVWLKKPILFGHGGIDSEPVKTGLEYGALTSTAILVYMQPLQQDLKAENMMSSDGVPLSFDAVIRFQITDSVRLLSTFGTGYYDQNIEREFFNEIRQQVRKHGMNEMSISTSAVDEVDAVVLAGMQKYVVSIGMPIKIIAVTVGKVDPPDAVRHQRIDTAQQEQRVNTERQRKLAEDARKQAEMARATADNAYRQEMQLNPDQFLKLEQIKMLRDSCGNTGKAGCTFILGSGATPVLNVGK